MSTQNAGLGYVLLTNVVLVTSAIKMGTAGVLEFEALYDNFVFPHKL